VAVGRSDRGRQRIECPTVTDAGGPSGLSIQGASDRGGAAATGPGLPAFLLAVAAGHVIWNRLVWDGIPLQTDAGIWAYIGGRLLDGAVLYRDLWDNKPPGVFHAFAVCQWLFGRARDWPLLWMDAVVSLAAGGLTYLLARRYASVVASAAAALLFSFIFCHRVLADWGCNAEKFVAVFEVSACLLAVSYLRRGVVGRGWICVGLLCGLATMFKQTGVVMLLAAGAGILLSAKRPNRPIQRGSIPWLWLGAAGPWMVICGWMMTAGNVDEFWRQVVVHDLHRAVANSEAGGPRWLSVEHWRGVWEQLRLAAVIIGPAAIAVVARLVHRRSRPTANTADVDPMPPDLALIVVYAALSLAVFLIAPHGYGHYLLQAAPPAAVLTAIALDGLRDAGRQHAVAGLTAVVGAFGAWQLGDHFTFLSDPSCPARAAYRAQAEAMAGRVTTIRANSDDGDRVMVWPTDHAASFYARRVTPLEIGHTIDIFRGNIRLLDPPMERIIDHVKSNPPGLIVDSTGVRVGIERQPDAGPEPYLLLQAGVSLAEPPGNAQPTVEGRSLAPLRAWVRENYGGQRRVGDSTVYFLGQPWRDWQDYMLSSRPASMR